jgi:hypothetical protein
VKALPAEEQRSDIAAEDMNRSWDAVVCAALLGSAALYWLLHGVPVGDLDGSAYWQYPDATRVRDIVAVVASAFTGLVVELRAVFLRARVERSVFLFNVASGALLLLVAAYGFWMIGFLDMSSASRGW